MSFAIKQQKQTKKIWELHYEYCAGFFDNSLAKRITTKKSISSDTHLTQEFNQLVLANCQVHFSTLAWPYW